jgi:hypothetical protein
MLGVDSRRERLAASLLGGAGTLLGISLYQVVPDLDLLLDLQLRPLNSAGFVAVIVWVGATGGYLGHRWFVSWKDPSLLSKAVVVGGVVGFGIAVVGWTITFMARSSLFPFAPFDAMDDLWRRWLLNALLAGPVGGVMASVIVVRHLQRLDRGESVGSLPNP